MGTYFWNMYPVHWYGFWAVGGTTNQNLAGSKISLISPKGLNLHGFEILILFYILRYCITEVSD